MNEEEMMGRRNAMQRTKTIRVVGRGGREAIVTLAIDFSRLDVDALIDLATHTVARRVRAEMRGCDAMTAPRVVQVDAGAYVVASVQSRGMQES
jgi:hypothetical protein